MGILEQFGTENYTWRIEIVESLCEFCQFFLSDFVGAKCPNASSPHIVHYYLQNSLHIKHDNFSLLFKKNDFAQLCRLLTF